MKRLFLATLMLLIPSCLCAQTGTPNFGSFSSTSFDTVNNQNLNVIFSIPIVSSNGRGISLDIGLVNNSLLWQKVSSAWTPVVDVNGNPTWGWIKDFPVGGTLNYTSSTISLPCPINKINVTLYSHFYYLDAFGTSHTFNAINYRTSSCPSQNYGTTAAYADDASGYYADASAWQVTEPTGKTVLGGVSTAVDANGNYVTKTIVSSTESDWTDSVGNKALKIIYSPSAISPTSIQYDFYDATGAYQTITAKIQAYSIKTNFACSGVTEYTGTAYMPYELDIPSPVSGTLKYLFTYEGTPSKSGYYTGRVKKVTLPTGGYYEWDYGTTNDGINCSDGTTLTMNRTVSDGTTSAQWNFVRNATNGTTTVTTPQLADTTAANDTVYTFSSGRETSRKIYSNSPGTTLVRTINTTYASNSTPATQTTILEDNNTQSEVATTYDSNGLLDSVTEYDWGSGAPGSPIRTTAYTYQTSTNYAARNIINLVTSKVIKDGSGTVQYRQDTAYDGTALTCPTGVAQHSDSGYPCTMLYRGNPTSVTTYISPAVPSGGITKNFTYDWFGNLLTAQLNCCTNKTWTYSATTKYSQPDSVTSGTSPNQVTTSYTYNAYTGLPHQVTDPNALVTTYAFDFLHRATSVAQAIGSTTGESVTNSYDDVGFTATSTTAIDGTNSVKQISAADKLGRTLATTLENGSGTVFSIVQNQYDLMGRAYKTSNPYTGSPSYWTVSAFDVLGRASSVTLPDNSAASYAYATNTATVTDPAGKQRKSASDAAGRLSTLTEPDVTSGNSLTLNTIYSYTVLDSLATVTQGAQTRTYNYDALGRLLSTVTPEGGSTCFGSVTGTTCNADGYDNFDNLQKRTDARGVLTSYVYDGLNRLTGVSYNVGSSGVTATPSIGLTYGTNAALFNNGHLITMTDGPGSENYTYSNLGQMTQLQKVISGTTYTTQYAYNISGELTQITYPSGRVIAQSTDSLGRLCAVGTSGSTCTTGTTYATGYAYSTAQQVTGFNYGNGVAAAFGYSPDRLQLSSLSYAKSGTTLFGQTYSYGTTGSNNGQVQKITDTVDNGRTATYTYDGLSRLSTAATVGSTGYPAWGLSWTYDRYANRTAETVTAGTGVPSNSISVSMTTNRVTTAGYAYDANGNMTNDGANTLVYDTENHALSATNGSTSGTYTYDGNGLRIKKVSGGTTTVYLFSGSKVVAEYDNGAAPTAPSREYVYGGTALLAKIDSSGTKYFHQDALSNRLVTSSTGTALEQLGHYPYGESWYNSTGDKLLFTSYERDAESGNDYAQARYYVNRLGRFLSLDPLSGSTSDPQSLNRYSYVTNNPISLADPSGMMETEACDDDDTSCGGGGGGGPDPCAGNTAPGGCIGVTAKALPLDPLTDPYYGDPSQGPGDLAFSGLGGPGGGINGAIAAARQQARLLLSDSNCANFLKGVISQFGRTPIDKIDLNNFLAGFDNLSIIPTPSPDPERSANLNYKTTAHVDVYAKSDVVHVDAPFAADLPATLLHEDFHTNNFGLYDQGLAVNIWKATGMQGDNPRSLNDKDASAYNTAAFNEHCIPKAK